jgi:catechol 2,3-dioxygenase-like lactoylglutathione lyase family enzyme
MRGVQLDHLVLWVEDPVRACEFYTSVVGLTAVRLDEFRAGKTLFVSVRISDTTLIDLFPKSAVPRIEAIPGAKGTAGHVTNHVCLAMTRAEYDALAGRLALAGTPVGHHMENQYGARGFAPRAFYFKDPDRNVLEARYYE